MVFTSALSQSSSTHPTPSSLLQLAEKGGRRAREFFSTPRAWTERGATPESWPGVPQGSLVEWCGGMGSGKTSLLLDLWSASPEQAWLWIEPSASAEKTQFVPQPWARRGLSLDRGWGVEVEPRDLGWTLLQALRSQAFAAVVVAEEFQGAWGTEGRPDHVTRLRRLQIAAERAGSSVLFLRERPTRAGAWPIAAQFTITRQERLQPAITVHRFLGARLDESLVARPEIAPVHALVSRSQLLTEEDSHELSIAL